MRKFEGWKTGSSAQLGTIWMGSLVCIFVALQPVCALFTAHIAPSSPSGLSSPSSSTVNHPWLFFSAEELAALQNQAVTTHQDIWAPILEYAEGQLGDAPPASAPTDADEDTFRTLGNQLIPVALSCVISEREDLCGLAKAYLLTFATWSRWNVEGQRDLGLAHMLLGNALGYDWLYPYLTPDERQSVSQSLAEWAQKLYEASSADYYEEDWNNWWRSSYMQNHFSINNSALGMAGLALLEEDARAQAWVDHASSQMAILHDILESMGDGTWHEGISYQNYLFTLTLPFLVNLRAIQGVDHIPHLYLQNYSYWRIYNSVPNNTEFVLAYGDFEWEWGNGYRAQNILRFVANEYNDRHAEWAAQQLLLGDPRDATVWKAPWYVFELFYYEPAVEPEAPYFLENARVFSDLNSVIWRTGWDEESLLFGFKAGTYGGAFAINTFAREEYPWDAPCTETGCQLNIDHAHDDSLGFYILRGERWLAPETVGVGRSAASFHNTLLIDDQGQYRPPPFWQDPATFVDAEAYLTAAASTESFSYAAADGLNRYKEIDGMDAVTRQVVFVRPGYFLILDNLAAQEPHRYTWISHFGQDVAIELPWIRGEADGDQILGVQPVAPDEFAAITGNDGQPYVHIEKEAQNVRFINLLYPTDTAGWANKPQATLLGDSGSAAAVRTQTSGQSHCIDDILLTYAPSGQPDGGAVEVAGYVYDGEMAVVRRNLAQQLQKVFVHDATFLTDPQGNQLVQNLERNTSMEITYAVDVLYIEGDVNAALTLFAPDAETLFVNGAPRPFSRSGEYITVQPGTVVGSTLLPPLSILHNTTLCHHFMLPLISK